MSATEIHMLHNLMTILRGCLQTLNGLSQSSEMNEHLLRDMSNAVCSLQFELAMTLMTSNVIPNQQTDYVPMTMGSAVSVNVRVMYLTMN